MKANGRSRHFSIGLSTNGIIAVVAWLAVLLVPSNSLRAATPEPVAFAQSAPATGVFEFIEVTATVRTPLAHNPFTDAALTGDFEPAGSAPGAAIEGFCDSTNGSVYRIRFMPSKADVYSFHVTFKDGQDRYTYLRHVKIITPTGLPRLRLRRGSPPNGLGHLHGRGLSDGRMV